MNQKNLLVFFFSIILLFPGIGNVYAHTAKIIGDLKFDVGWKKEPPLVDEPNALEIIIKVASNYDKQKYDSASFQIIGDPDEKITALDLSGLSQSFEVNFKLSNEKKIILIYEDENFPGIYYGDLTPKYSGTPTIHIYGIIKNMEFEAEFNPEKIESISDNQIEPNIYSIPDWVRNNAGWWAEGLIDDSDFISGLQYLIKENILNIPKTETVQSSSNEIPDWIRNSASWWSQELISDDDFVKGIQYLIEQGIIQV